VGRTEAAAPQSRSSNETTDRHLPRSVVVVVVVFVVVVRTTANCRYVACGAFVGAAAWAATLRIS